MKKAQNVSVQTTLEHQPVMLDEVVEQLNPQPGESYLDVTLGLGGHACAIAEKIGSQGKIIGVDADEENLQFAKDRLQSSTCTQKFHHGNFGDVPNLELEPVDMILADLGVSSPHFDDPERGFSFRFDGPLDLRFDRSQGLTAAKLIAQASEQELAEIFWNYGELKAGRKLARTFKEQLPDTTQAARDCVENCCGRYAASELPQVFQALRIAVNEELHALETLLAELPTLLRSGGRCVVLSYHSLEDRLVKQAFKNLSTPIKNDHTGAVAQEADFLLPFRKPLLPTTDEIERNQRARSAKLRALKKKSPSTS